MQRLESFGFLSQLPLLQLQLFSPSAHLSLEPQLLLLEAVLLIFKLGPGVLQPLLVVAVGVAHTLLQSKETFVLSLQPLALQCQSRSVIHLAIFHVAYKLRHTAALVFHLLRLRRKACLHVPHILLASLELSFPNCPLERLICLHAFAHPLNLGDRALHLLHELRQLLLARVRLPQAISLHVCLLLRYGESAIVFAAQLFKLQRVI
mmetsp:Transcript_39705/g.68783  ORF Transcript_39705/g.68783 Transcript_39705/m.68783 type:complete len:206 (+) Transcript_39705:562-1179(+)